MMTFAEYLSLNKIKQADAADDLGVAQATVSRLVSRTVLPSLIVAARIERYTQGLVPASSWVNCETEKGAA